MKTLIKIIIFFIISILPISTFAIFHDEWTTYFFQNKITKEIRYFAIARDLNAWYFNYSISDYLENSLINNNNFVNYNFIEADYCRRWHCNYTNSWVYNFTDLSIYTRGNNFPDYNKITNTYYLSGSNLSINNLNTFTINDLDKSEKFKIYYKYIILNYIDEFFWNLFFNLITFYFLWYFVFSKIKNNYYKLGYSLILSLVLYSFSDAILYFYWFWYSQVTRDLGWIIEYWIKVWILKLPLFIVWFYFLLVDIWKLNLFSKLKNIWKRNLKRY